MRHTLTITIIGVLVLVSMALENRTNAIPALARKYKTSCLTCHSMTPRLNAFGEAVRLNGFRWPDADAATRKETDEEKRKEEPVKLGAESYKKVWPKAVWPSDIPGTVPLGIRDRTFFRSILGKGDSPFDRVGWELEFFTAAALGDDVSMWGHFNVEGEVVSFAEAKDKEKVKTKVVVWLTLENLGNNLGLSSEDLVNLELGIIGFEEHDLPHYRSHSTYRVFTQKAFYTGMRVPYPSGFMEKDLYKLRRGPGAMVYGFTSWMQYALGYQIGMQEGGGTDQNVGFFQLAYKLGGMDHYGRTKQSFQFGHQENSLGLGLFASIGEAKVQESEATARMKDTFWRFGVDTRWRHRDFTLHAGTMIGRHNKPYGTLNSERVDLKSWFVAPEYYWFPWLMTGLRYEQEDIDVPGTLNLGDLERRRFHPYVTLLHRANLRFTLEGLFYEDRRHNASGVHLDDDEITFVIDITI